MELSKRPYALRKKCRVRNIQLRWVRTDVSPFNVTHSCTIIDLYWILCCVILNEHRIWKVVVSTPRCRASASNKHSLRIGGALVTAVTGCRATGSRDYATARPRWPCDGVCPPRRLRRWWNGTRGNRTCRRSRATRLPLPLVQATQQMPSSSLAWRLCQRAGPVGRQGVVPGGTSELGAPPIHVSSETCSRIRGSCVVSQGP